MRILLLFLISSSVSFGQNDSILPNQLTTYNLVKQSVQLVNGTFDFVYSSESISIDNSNNDDTLDIIYQCGNPYGIIALDSLKAYYTGLVYNGFDYINSTVLLYDFGLQVGDTAYLEYITGTAQSPQPVIVNQVINELVYSDYKKVLYLSNSEKWIQGFGSNLHLLWPVMNHFETSYTVCSAYCYYLGPSNYYEYMYETDCSFATVSIPKLSQIQPVLVSTVDLLGKKVEAGFKGFAIEVYSDGSTIKIFRID